MKRRIRVLEVLEATVGGTRKHLVSLLRGLDKQRVEVEVACPSVRYGSIKDTGFVEEVQSLGVPLHFIDMRRGVSPFIDLKGIIQLFQLIYSRQYDIVHVHSSKAGFLGRIAAKLGGIKTVYTPNGFYFLNSDNLIKSKVFLLLEQLAGLLTDSLIAVSDSEREIAVKNRIIADQKVVVIPNAIDPEEFLPDLPVGKRIRAELNISPSTIVVGTVSRYIPQKDPLTFIRAAHLVLASRPQTRFVWCGEGEMREEIEALARQLEIYEAFYFLGFRHDVKDIMNAFDLFVLSSIFEGLPYTLLEVMALGLPVIATHVVGSKDIVVDGETGILVPPQQPERLAQAILELLADQQRRQEMGQRGQQTVHNRYSLKKTVADVEKVYQVLI